MSQQFGNGDRVIWSSAKGRQRMARVVCAMKASPGKCLVVVLIGLPGEEGSAHVIPQGSLSVAP
jgi:hypothetical protein